MAVVADPAAGRQRRQKMIAVAGALILVVVLAVQGPRTLRMLRGDSGAPAPVAAPAPVETAGSGATTAPAVATQSLAAVLAAEQSALRRSARRAPAPPATSVPVAAGTPARAGTGESLARVLAGERRLVRTVNRLYVFDRLGYTDPFTGASGATPAKPARGRTARPATSAVPGVRGSWTVVVHSLPSRFGRAYALRVARRVSVRLKRPVGVLRSSSRANLRAGYYLVHTGAFRSRAAARQALRQARRVNRTAYTRFVDPA